MKLILAIINNDDSGIVSHHLTSGGFSVTKLATTGGFLKTGNTTFLIGVEDSKQEEALAIIEKYSRKRTQTVPATSGYDMGMFSTFPVEVTIGGATIFILNVERFEKY